MKIKLVPSIMCANFTDLENDIREMEEAKVDYLHFDIMDGHFVPNFTMGVDIIRSIRKITDIPFDTHLMIYNSERFIEQFAQAGSDIISVHPESSIHIQKSLTMIKKLGVKPAIALNPATPLSILDYIIDDVEMILVMTVNPGFAGQRVIPSTINKIKDLRNWLKDYGLEMDVEVLLKFPVPLGEYDAQNGVITKIRSNNYMQEIYVEAQVPSESELDVRLIPAS